MMGFTPVELGLLAVAALLVGFAKTAIGGVAGISVAIFAAVMPARESTGALLVLLIVGDLFALHAYRQHADWPALRRLFPSVAVGVLVGVVFLANVGDTGVRRTIGVLLLILVAVHLWQRARVGKVPAADGVPAPLGDDELPPLPPGAVTRQRGLPTVLGAGILAGFTTMVANAGGAVMSLYLLSAGMGMLGFLGTAAWFFFVVNVFKLPFSAGLGLISVDSLRLNVLLVPAVVVGAVVGRAVIRRLDQDRFEWLVLGFTVLTSLNLIR